MSNVCERCGDPVPEDQLFCPACHSESQVMEDALYNAWLEKQEEKEQVCEPG